ncbi:Crp/Fnr family transcriptional regulator [Flavobacterium sp. '19STA2R22 D10 B1']|uniref:Crp/Fnr family transcriptional regulator n=1 Tax=Flavobacterium aerium TaxID=3037261 RepID=UPI00278C3A6D|nr:Crp/Fnr family transcriptional regulator [Flavobacterium sp. '19STA2R22 D10 B1']
MKAPVNLATHIQKFVVLNEEEIQQVQTFFAAVQVKKKEYILEEGTICKNNYFVEKGCLRMFFRNEKGVEQTTQFAIENWWISDYMSFTMQSPATFSIQAVEHSEIISISIEKLEEMFLQVPKMERYFRAVYQKTTAANQIRMKYLYEFSREEQYRHFSTSFPEFIQRIPQYMLASYLGFTPEYLSEIRKKQP